ncbi:hypothetical protein [Enterococcus termitis]|uniref:Uncharacterized protein n=1 Tax=Enterococcus termitis TaxID=332950 RepID=A0A1E5GKD9_9ENTE|nr:hypothetical protein [Enterococcus termitis]OEG13147.1 hypothetical protein BCR25_06575 [Enterococcus termitis]OJG98986.1 hypothetical protein RV18_GL002140 [Enterococcus termitis]
MRIKKIERCDNYCFKIFFEDDSTHNINKSEYFESLVLLVIKIMDANIEYNTSKNAFEFDSCVNFLYVVYQSTIYVENIHNKKLLYFNFVDDDFNSFTDDLWLEENIRKVSETAFPDFYTYFTGAYANLGVLYKTLKKFVKKMGLTYRDSKNEMIEEFTFIRNKLLIHPEDNMALADNVYTSISSMNQMDWHQSVDKGLDMTCMFHYFHKGNQHSVDLAANYLQYVQEIIFEFLEILLKNDFKRINNDDFSMEHYFFDF